MIPVISSPCEAAREQADACHHDPRLGAGDACLEVLGKATVASEPSEGAFDHPSSRLWLEGPEGLGSGDDLDRPPAQLGDCNNRLFARLMGASLHLSSLPLRSRVTTFSMFAGLIPIARNAATSESNKASKVAPLVR